jgi:hypothetical protein
VSVLDDMRLALEEEATKVQNGKKPTPLLWRIGISAWMALHADLRADGNETAADPKGESFRTILGHPFERVDQFDGWELRNVRLHHGTTAAIDLSGRNA